MTTPLRTPGIVAGIALGLVAPLALGTHAYFTRPLAEGVTEAGDQSVAMAALAALLLAVGGGVIVARRSRLRAAIAWTAALVGSMVFALAASRSAEVDRERLVRDMPVAGELAGDGPPLGVGSLTVGLQRAMDDEPSGMDAWGRSFSCRVRIAAPAREHTVLAVGWYAGCRRVRVRHDALNGVAVIEHIPLWAAAWSDEWQRLAVHSTRDGSPMSLDVLAFRRSMAVPPEWAALTAFAMAIALTFLLAALAGRRRGAKLGALVDAVHVGDGWFAMTDGRRVHAAWAGELPLGEFSVRVTEPGETLDYRASAAAIVEPVERGAASAHASKARDLVATCEGIALTTAALGMTPTIVALNVLMS